MNQKNLNRITMWQTVYAVLQNNQSVWMGNMKFSEKVVELKTLIDAVALAAKAQNEGSTGITEDKESLAEKAIALTSFVSKVAH